MPLKILVVDDATFVRDMIKRTARQLVPNADIFDAPDGQRAQSIIKSKHPDLIISDWEMPNMNGDELLLWLRDQEQFKDTPFIMVTSRGDKNHVVEAVNMGVSDFLSKPFSPDELTKKINKQLARLGIKPKAALAAANKGMAFSSIEVLTGGKASSDDNMQSPPTAESVAKPKPKPSAAKAGLKFKGKAYIRFAHTTCECTIKEMSVQALCGIVNRPDQIPMLFDQASVDLIGERGDVLARVNAYVHSLSATEPNPATEVLRIIVRFTDADPAKQEIIASLIG